MIVFSRKDFSYNNLLFFLTMLTYHSLYIKVLFPDIYLFLSRNMICLFRVYFTTRFESTIYVTMYIYVNYTTRLLTILYQALFEESFNDAPSASFPFIVFPQIIEKDFFSDVIPEMKTAHTYVDKQVYKLSLSVCTFP